MFFSKHMSKLDNAIFHMHVWVCDFAYGVCSCAYVCVFMCMCVRVYAFIYHEMCLNSSKNANLNENCISV